MLRKTLIVAIAAVLAACAGCQTHEQNKKLAKERWQKASAQIKLALAQQQYGNGQYKEAEKNIRECLDADPQIPQAHLLFGKLLVAQGQTPKASGELQLAVELDENLHEGWYWLGVTAQQFRQTDRAWSHYNKAMTLAPTNVDYILAVAETWNARRQPEEAIKMLRGKMQIMPTQISLKVAAADTLSRLGRNQQAAELYKQAMLLANENSNIAESLGYCYVFDGQWEQAAEIFNELARRFEDHTTSQKQISAEDKQRKKLYLQTAALCSMKSGRYDQAVNCYGKLTIHERENAEVWVKMGQAALGAGLTRRALMCARKANSLRPGYADAAALMGCAQYADGNYTQAAETFKRITADKNNAAFAWLMTGRCYEQLGELDRADGAYTKALQINPDSELGRFLAKAKDGGN